MAPRDDLEPGQFVMSAVEVGLVGKPDVLRGNIGEIDEVMDEEKYPIQVNFSGHPGRVGMDEEEIYVACLLHKSPKLYSDEEEKWFCPWCLKA